MNSHPLHQLNNRNNIDIMAKIVLELFMAAKIKVIIHRKTGR